MEKMEYDDVIIFSYYATLILACAVDMLRMRKEKNQEIEKLG